MPTTTKKRFGGETKFGYPQKGKSLYDLKTGHRLNKKRSDT